MKNFKENASRLANKLIFKTKKHSPEILMVVGAVSIVTGTVKACQATLKFQDVLTETSDTIDKIHEVADGVANGTVEIKEGETYTKDDMNKDLTIVYIQTAVKTVKLYAPAFILIGGGLGCMFGSHIIMRKRNAAAVAAYTAVTQAFNEYKNRVKERFGEEVEREISTGVKAVEVDTGEVDENGNPKTETIKVADNNASPYALLYNDTNRNWTDDADYNHMFLKQAQNLANLRLKKKGYLFLSEVYEMLGEKATKVGNFAGWIYDPKNPSIDSYVDFGLYDGDHVDYDELFSNGIWLNFNVDGNIINKI